MNDAKLAAAIAPAQLIAEDLRRSRELYRYLQPSILSPTPLLRRRSTTETQGDVPNLTASLAPFVQLAALRCNAAKSMLNVMDKDKMYFLAQASKRPKGATEDTPMFETAEDGVFMGCSSVPLSGRVCEITIREKPDFSQEYPMFVVSDLSQDARFSELDVVKGAPFYKFYAGTPITTDDGVNIGSLAVMDPNAREGLTEDEERCLGQTATHIMSYLELNREAIKGEKARRMGEGLNCFVAGKSRLAGGSASVHTPTRVRKRSSYGIAENLPAPDDHKRPFSPKVFGALGRRNRKGDQDSGASSPTESEDEGSQNDDESSADVDESESRLHGKTFARAANLLRQSLDVGDDGGVLFVGVEASASCSNLLTRTKPKPIFEEDSSSTTDEITSIEPSHAAGSSHSKFAAFLRQPKSTPALTLACSTSFDPLFEGHGTHGQKGLQIGAEVVSYFLDRFPSGKLWSLDDGYGEYSLSDDDASVSSRIVKTTRSRRKQAECEYLRQSFPDARQLLMMPLSDTSQGRIVSVCFVWTSSETCSFSIATELRFLNAFGQTLVAECNRIDAVRADKQKSDFVGTISHEMRSPLHGILASVEFLSESEMSSFQRSLIETVDACGRTLLDTINHVLDFSKINSFEKDWQTSNKDRDRSKRRSRIVAIDASGGVPISSGAPPLLQLFGATDISAVLEEVVEGITVGQMYTSNIDITDLSRAARGRNTSAHPSHPRRIDDLSPNTDSVEVILDIQRNDWVFMTQPGAVRRIIMNIFGNAMKYTQHGSIKVQLQLDGGSAPADQTGDQILLLTVTDTGKGISPRFLASRLFMPFAQENSLAPGTGLGLSICKSLVNMLGGNIDVKSRINSGTTVTVSLPVTRAMVGSQSAETSPHSGNTSTLLSSVISARDRSISVRIGQGFDCRVALHGFQGTGECTSKQELGSNLEKYVTDWYGLEVVSSDSGSANVIIVEEQDLSSLLSLYPVTNRRPLLIVLCVDAARHSQAAVDESQALQLGRVEFIAKPCGPYKLARALRTCLENMKALQASNLGVIHELPTPVLSSYENDVAGGLQELNLGDPGDNAITNMVQANEELAASQTSRNAQMAITAPSTTEHEAEKRGSFPFPTVITPTPPTSLDPDQRQDQPTLAQPRMPHERQQSISDLDSPTARLSTVTKKPTPRVLLVDDNNINLLLLQTFLKKRKYDRISCAKDGQAAVDLATTAAEPFEIIFMDISMPIMNGFEATRAIRRFEERNKITHGAMIIALTGLASGRDQSEGFAAGCDIYMTKPVSFKEVGKLLDNWEAHQ